MLRELKIKYRKQKHHAKKRGIQFLLTFDEWYKIWNDSGHLPERGRSAGKYCMARFGDIGPYAIGNVEIILVRINGYVANIGRKLTESHKRNIGAAHKGKVHPRALDANQISFARRLLAGKMSQDKVAALLGISQPCLSRSLRRK